MLYRPTFCCNCGSKIERINWNLWTSRRFCENCETEFRKDEWLPVILPLIFTLFSGLFAFGSYLKTPEKTLSVTRNEVTANSIDKSQDTAAQEKANMYSVRTVAQVSTVSNNQNTAKSKDLSSKTVNFASLQNEETVPVYFCGAQTKKGTACVRKVKGGGRCWQHTGQVSMLPKDKLAAGH